MADLTNSIMPQHRKRKVTDAGQPSRSKAAKLSATRTSTRSSTSTRSTSTTEHDTPTAARDHQHTVSASDDDDLSPSQLESIDAVSQADDSMPRPTTHRASRLTTRALGVLNELHSRVPESDDLSSTDTSSFACSAAREISAFVRADKIAARNGQQEQPSASRLSKRASVAQRSTRSSAITQPSRHSKTVNDMNRWLAGIQEATALSAPSGDTFDYAHILERYYLSEVVRTHRLYPRFDNNINHDIPPNGISIRVNGVHRSGVDILSGAIGITGMIRKVGANITSFSPDDKVIACASSNATRRIEDRHMVTLDSTVVFPRPESLTRKQAAQISQRLAWIAMLLVAYFPDHDASEYVDPASHVRGATNTEHHGRKQTALVTGVEKVTGRLLSWILTRKIRNLDVYVMASSSTDAVAESLNELFGEDPATAGARKATLPEEFAAWLMKETGSRDVDFVFDMGNMRGTLKDLVKYAKKAPGIGQLTPGEVQERFAETMRTFGKFIGTLQAEVFQ